MKRQLFKISLTVFVGILVVVLLYGFSVKDIYFEDNGFTRSISSSTNFFIKKRELDEKVSEILKVTDSGVFMLNENHQEVFFYDFTKAKMINLKFSKLFSRLKLFNIHQVVIDGEEAIWTSPRNRMAYKFDYRNITNRTIIDSIELEFGADKIGILDNNYMIKGRDSIYQALFYKIQKCSKSKQLLGETVIANTRKALIEDDGFFINGDKYLVYPKYHKSEFFFSDGENKIFKKIPTIDPNSELIKVREDKNGVVTILGEIEFKNKRGSIDDNLLYLQSGVKADNEGAFRFKFNSIVDVYDLSKVGEYLYSFYIPSYSGVKANSFKVKNNIVFAAHGNYLITYDIKTLTNEN